MFEDKFIHGDYEGNVNYARVYWDVEEGAIGLEFIDEATGERDGDTQLFSPWEAQALGWALINAYGSTFDADGRPRVAFGADGRPRVGAHGGK